MTEKIRSNRAGYNKLLQSQSQQLSFFTPAEHRPIKSWVRSTSSQQRHWGFLLLRALHKHRVWATRTPRCCRHRGWHRLHSQAKHCLFSLAIHLDGSQVRPPWLGGQAASQCSGPEFGLRSLHSFCPRVRHCAWSLRASETPPRFPSSSWRQTKCIWKAGL